MRRSTTRCRLLSASRSRIPSHSRHSASSFPQSGRGYAGRELEQAAAQLAATIIRPRRKDEPGSGPHLAPIRQRIESIFHTCKDLLTLERHGARTLHGLHTRICARFLALAAAISLNHRLGRPPRALVDYTA